MGSSHLDDSWSSCGVCEEVEELASDDSAAEVIHRPRVIGTAHTK